MSALVDDVFSLYEGVVTDPASWTEQAIVDWSDGVASMQGMDRLSGKYLRRVLTTATKLKRFWEEDGRLTDQSIGWKSRVDIALGPKAWRPVLDLAMHELGRTPDPNLFATVSELFRVVNNRPWLEGMDYDQWLQDASRIR